MTVLDQFLTANRVYLEETNSKMTLMDKLPKRGLALITCMDTRLVELLEAAIGLQRGDAIIIKSAGTVVGNCFDTVLRSLIIAIYELGIKEIVVVGHEDCGVTQTSVARLKEKMRERGIHEQWIDQLAGHTLDWLNNIEAVDKEIENLVAALRSNPLIPHDIPVHGILINPVSGLLSILVNGY